MTRQGYDELGNLISTTLPDGSVQTSRYQLQGNLLIESSGSQTYPVSYRYDSQGRKTGITTTNAVGPTETRWVYDGARGWMTAKIYPDNTQTAYTYTAAGRLQTRTWARGVVTTYSYNNAGDLTLTDYSDATPDVAIAFDRLGRTLNVTDGTGIRETVYDSTTMQVAMEKVPTPQSGVRLKFGSSCGVK